jgi:single-strand DNA-binding protein
VDSQVLQFGDSGTPGLSRTFLESAPGRGATRIRTGRVAGLCPAARTTRSDPGFPAVRIAVGRFFFWFAAGIVPDCSIRRKPMTNLVILVGRIARDPETRTTQSGTSITSISVVTDRPARKDGKTFKDENGFTAKDSEFHRVTCFNGLGQNVAKFCTKGQLVTVEGRIHYTQWEDQNGAKRYGCEIIADTVDFLTKGRSGTNDSAPDIED